MVPTISIRTLVATPPAVVMLSSRVQGVEGQVAPLELNEWTTGEPFNVPAAQEAVPQVSAPDRIELLAPPVKIGVIVGEPWSAQQETAVIVQSDCQTLAQLATS